MQTLIIEFIEQYGYVSIFLFILLENIFPPIPSEVILGFGGFMTTYSELKILYVIVASTLGSILGAVILYILGRFLTSKGIEKIILRWGKLLNVNMGDIEKANTWFSRFGYYAVFICRMIPIIRSLISIPAGIYHMKWRHFLLLTTAGTLIWNTILVLLGALLGNSWNRIIEYINIYSYIACITIVIIICIYIVRKIYFKYK